MTNSIIPDVCDRPLPAKRAPKRSIPDGACDCHFHVFDTPSKQVSERTYTALDATVDEYMQLRDVLGLARGVLVQPSVYGLDNETTLRSASKIPNVKSVVVIDQTTPISEIQRMADAGAVGAGSGSGGLCTLQSPQQVVGLSQSRRRRKCCSPAKCRSNAFLRGLDACVVVS